MIKANYAQQNRNCVREWGQGFTNPFSQFKDVLLNNFYVPNTAQAGRDQSAFNHGYRSEYSWHKPLKEGALASTGQILGTGSLAGIALAVKLAQAALSGSGDLTAIGSLIVQAIADLSGSGSISDAQINAFLNAVASLSGSGEISDASLEGFGALIASILGSGTAAGSTASGLGALAAELTVTGTGLSVANVGQAVWSALAAANNTSGTMGEKLNDAGSAGNPWAALLASNNDPNTFGELVQQLETLIDELHKLQGLDSANPMTVTPTSREAGDIALTISGDGITTTTVTRT
jgi:hypothetical protein